MDDAISVEAMDLPGEPQRAHSLRSTDCRLSGIHFTVDTKGMGRSRRYALSLFEAEGSDRNVPHPLGP